MDETEVMYTKEEILSSILLSVREMVCGNVEGEDFDIELIVHINSAFSVLHQLGVGPKKPYRITGIENQWSEFIGDNDDLEMVKDYIPNKVKLTFDPPSSSFVLESLKVIIAEQESRLNYIAEYGEE